MIINCIIDVLKYHQEKVAVIVVVIRAHRRQSGVSQRIDIIEQVQAIDGMLKLASMFG